MVLFHKGILIAGEGNVQPADAFILRCTVSMRLADVHGLDLGCGTCAKPHPQWLHLRCRNRRNVDWRHGLGRGCISGIASNVYGFYPDHPENLRDQCQLPGLRAASRWICDGCQTQFGIAAWITLGSGGDRRRENESRSRCRCPRWKSPSTKSNPCRPLVKVDLLKSLQLLPGVQSGGEGTSGLYVRGISRPKPHAPRRRAVVQREPFVWVFQCVQRGCSEEHEHH